MIRPLTSEAYSPFGEVIAARTTPPRMGNQGRASIWDRLAPLENRRVNATPNLSLFRTVAWPEPFVDVRVLERHPRSTQLFVPMTAARYLVIVAPGADAPDLSRLAAFVAGPDQGITYHPGTWHHPLLALDRDADFTCLVWEDGTAEDCEIVRVEGPRIHP